MSRDPDAQVRPVDPSEVGLLARLWYDGWQDAHAAIVPAELARRRTLPRFEERLRAALDNVRTVGPIGAPLGFALIKGDELYQLYVSAAARGTGVASTLIADAEARLRTHGDGDRLARLRHRQQPGRTLLREVRMAPRRHGRGAARDARGPLPARALALREAAAASGPALSRSNAVQRSRAASAAGGRPHRMACPRPGPRRRLEHPPSSGSGRGKTAGGEVAPGKGRASSAWGFTHSRSMWAPKCRCGPVTRPVFPTRPRSWPRFTSSPCFTRNFDRWK